MSYLTKIMKLKTIWRMKWRTPFWKRTRTRIYHLKQGKKTEVGDACIGHVGGVPVLLFFFITDSVV